MSNIHTLSEETIKKITDEQTEKFRKILIKDLRKIKMIPSIDVKKSGRD